VAVQATRTVHPFDCTDAVTPVGAASVAVASWFDGLLVGAVKVAPVEIVSISMTALTRASIAIAEMRAAT
jgi:hypothetical protein